MKDETKKLPKARRDDLFIEEMDGGLLVYDAKYFCAHRLNETAAWMWRRCDGSLTVAQATHLLSDELQQPLDEELVWLSLDTLDKAYLLDTPVQRPRHSTGDSRRAMLQKVATAGGLMFLLPVVTPLTSATRAQDDTTDANANAGASTTPIEVNIVTNINKTVRKPTGGSSLIRIPAIKGSSINSTGVEGRSTQRPGVFGLSEQTDGILGRTNAPGGKNFQGSYAAGVCGFSSEGYGVKGTSSNISGVYGHSEKHFGVEAASDTGTAFLADGRKSGKAALFLADVEIQGNAQVSGDIRLVNGDCAEDFDIVDAQGKEANAEAGTVMVLCDRGALQPSAGAYDKRVAGVISGAGDYKPGMVLDKRPTGRLRQPVALMGKVFCKADARYGAIEAGDLLTTSDTPGHAMKAQDPTQAFGAVVGKALRGLSEGQGLIPILVSLQ